MQTKFILPENEMPEAWYNILADLPAPPAPALHPATKQSIGPDDQASLFPIVLIVQSFNDAR